MKVPGVRILRILEQAKESMSTRWRCGAVGWRTARNRGGDLVPNSANAYARAINLRAQWRLSIAVDTLLRAFKETGILALSVVDLGDVDWPIDPFDDQPLRYRNIDGKAFVVYSIGPDEIDGDGEELFVTGVLYLDREFDIGYRFTLK